MSIDHTLSTAISADGCRIQVHQWSSGSPARGTVLALPGLGATATEVWKKLAHAMVPHGYLMVSLDWRGHGASDPAPGRYSMAWCLADALAAWRTKPYPTPIHLIGHSFGGCICAALAVRQVTAQPASLAVLSTRLPGDPQFAAQLHRVARALDRRGLASEMTGAILRSALISALTSEPTLTRLAQSPIATRTLWLTGASDRIVGTDTADVRRASSTRLLLH